MYDCTQSRDAINHYLPKFPEYCPAYHSLALFQTFQYPWLFEKGRSSASSMSLFRTHRRSTAEQKCESKCRKQKKKKRKGVQSAQHRQKTEGQVGVFTQTIVLLFLLTFIIAIFDSFSMRITYLFDSPVWHLSLFFASMIKIHRRSTGNGLYLLLVQFHVFTIFSLNILSQLFSRKLAVFCLSKH